mmetsp:Transcript_23931/g.32916  ORF Transcript_23931/g.32916 Transcript_23931/m.32916 type:complete len:111 (-) Transcript_23931:90-422(-)
MINSLPFDHAIGDVDFSWIMPEKAESLFLNAVEIHFSKRHPQSLLPSNKADSLLVVSYAWDSNSWPGNEFYSGSLDGSGDPAAASCSMIAELHNAEINCENMSGECAVVF